MTGEALESITNGLFPATRHRVTITPKVTEKRESVAFFIHADHHVPLKNVPINQNAKEEGRIDMTAGELINLRRKQTYN